MCGVKFFFYLALVGFTDIGLGETDDVQDNDWDREIREKIIIDTDAGSDDGVAILNVLGAEELFQTVKVHSITTVNGNTHVDNVAKNVLKVLKIAQRLNIPVYRGANQSILETPKIDNYFGKDGFGDFHFPSPPPDHLIKEEHAVWALVDSVNLHPEEITLLCLGPLTNIALAIRLDDKFIDKLKDIYVLGGSDSAVGNIRPGIEFNFHVDPEAASIVLSEAARKNKTLNLLTWETASIRITIPIKWRKEVLGAVKSPQLDLLNKAENITLVGEEWISADSLLSSAVLDKSIVESSDVYHATVETCGKNSRGGLYIDYNHVTKNKMTLVQPTPEQQLKIRSELNENVDTRAQDLQTIKEWLELQPHLPKTFDDGRLMTFLRGCKFSLEKTKRKLDMYFTMRAAIPEFFSNRNPFEPSIQEIMKQIHIPPLPGLTPEGRRVIIMRGVDKDQMTPNVAEAMKIVFMIGDVRLLEESIGVGGDVYILDAAAATPAHFAKFTPTLIKKFLVCAQEAYPVKLKEVHIVNVSPLVDTIVNFVKPFLKEKIRNRIFFHTDGYASLYKYVPKEILPEEYGGFAGPIAEMNEQWLRKLESYKDWFLQQEDIKADESKRPGKPKTHDDLFGVEGSFRKLVID